MVVICVVRGERREKWTRKGKRGVLDEWSGVEQC